MSGPVTRLGRAGTREAVRRVLPILLFAAALVIIAMILFRGPAVHSVSTVPGSAQGFAGASRPSDAGAPRWI